MARDPYAVLGVAKDASTAEIKKSYRKLAKFHHPDPQPGDAKTEQTFKEISQANTLLGDENKRARYDAGESTPPVGSGHRPISTIKPPPAAGFATRRGETRPTSTISSPICSAREADLALVDIDRSAARTPAVPPPGDDIHLTLPVVSWRSRARWQGPGADSDQAGVADNSNSGRVMPLKEQRGRHDGKPAAD